MPLFDFYIIVDWSGASARRGMKADSIWLAFGSIADVAPKSLSPFSRSEATQFINGLLREQLSQGRRTLVGFDFAYAFPRDFPAALQAATGTDVYGLPWLAVWDFLRREIKDDQGTSPDRRPSNRSNRFEIANGINSLLSEESELRGPFWCGSNAAYPYLPQTRPKQPFPSAQKFLIQSLRFTDLRARSGTPFRLFGTANVGSQSLTGIPRLHQLRFDPHLKDSSAVWPFETGWATSANWPPESVSILHAEIYPSVRDPLPDAIKDRGQVRSMWEWAVELDRQDLLWLEFGRPVDIDPGSPEDIAVQLTEGWILGCSNTVRNH
jgi:precorrin-8X/cobalt-precorrin-8 methylmutase